ncbi:UNVERIFIED_CONTAM: hypothetical protein FKN15_072862 [Acipenser sinensis]
MAAASSAIQLGLLHMCPIQAWLNAFRLHPKRDRHNRLTDEGVRMGVINSHQKVQASNFVSTALPMWKGRLYAMQTGMKLDSKTPECRKFLVKLMDQLETMKKELGDNESISQELVGHAHIENYALKMFLYADNEDRSGRFHKNMIKSFYTASLLLDVLSVFGELSEENFQHRKYAKWKATYIHNCLKNGEVPQSGPIGMEGEEYDDEYDVEHGAASQPSQPSPHVLPRDGPGANTNFSNIQIPPGAHAPANTPAEVPHFTGEPCNPVQPVPRNIPVVDPSLLNASQQGEVRLTPEDYTRAQKYCKYAGSALQYEDVGAAVQNLQKALKLLTTGRE